MRPSAQSAPGAASTGRTPRRATASCAGGTAAGVRTPQAPLGGTGLRGTLDLERPAERHRANAPTPTPRAARRLGARSPDRCIEHEDLRPGSLGARRGTARGSCHARRWHVVESLNSLSVDIARAIDHDASIELWNRYRRGERDVFTAGSTR